MPFAKSSAKPHARHFAKLKGDAQLTIGKVTKKSPSTDGLSRKEGTNAWRFAQGFSL
jgi:hypothetical protein